MIKLTEKDIELIILEAITDPAIKDFIDWDTLNKIGFNIKIKETK